jgi:hypothetical protein
MLLSFLSMQRLIGGVVIGLYCLQWSLPASAVPATCSISKNATLLIPNTILATQLNTDPGSFFKLTCSCPANMTRFSNNGGTVTLSIIGTTPTPAQINSSAGISLPSSGPFSIATAPVAIQLVLLSSPLRTREQTFGYSVRVATSDGSLLQARSDYSVTVQFLLSATPECTTGGSVG